MKKILICGAAMGVGSRAAIEALKALDETFEVEMVSPERVAELNPDSPREIVLPIKPYHLADEILFTPPMSRRERRALERKKLNKS